MRILKHLTLVALLALVSGALATQKKLPLTLKQFGKQYYLQWTGTNFVTLSADTVSFYIDTANSYAANPTALLYNKKINIDREDVNAGERFPEKLCAYFVSRSDADSSTAAYDVFYSTSRNGTAYLASTQTATVAGTTNVGSTTSFPLVPGLFPIIKSRITSATDSVVYQQATFWGCDD